MSMSACIHNADCAEARSDGFMFHWVWFKNPAGNDMTLFCPSAEVAKATADAFNKAMVEHREAEGSVTAETGA